MSEERKTENAPVRNDERTSFLAKIRSLKDWFELDVTIKIFGVTVLHWHYPPSPGSPSNS